VIGQGIVALEGLEWSEHYCRVCYYCEVIPAEIKLKNVFLGNISWRNFGKNLT